jgi:hypothetical protein
LRATGLAGDWQDGPVDAANLEWQIDGVFAGAGESLDLAGLQPEEHSLVLSATASSGLTGMMEVRFEVMPFDVSIERPATGTLKLAWPVGTLQWADDPLGPYSEVPGAQAPYQIQPVGPQKFFRVRIH